MMNFFVWSLASSGAVSTGGKCFGPFVADSMRNRVMGTFHDSMEIEPLGSYRENVTFAVSALVSSAYREMMICSCCDLRSAIYDDKAKLILMR